MSSPLHMIDAHRRSTNRRLSHAIELPGFAARYFCLIFTFWRAAFERREAVPDAAAREAPAQRRTMSFERHLPPASASAGYLPPCSAERHVCR